MFRILHKTGGVGPTSGWNCCSVRVWQQPQCSPASQAESSPHPSSGFTREHGVDLKLQHNNDWSLDHIITRYNERHNVCHTHSTIINCLFNTENKPHQRNTIKTMFLLGMHRLPIIGIGIGRLLPRYWPTVIYSFSKYSFLLDCVSTF